MKVKICGVCLKEVPALWKAKRKLPDGTIQPGMCKECANKPKMGEIYGSQQVISITPISKLSDKEKKRQAAYSVLKKEFMKSHKYCEAKLPGCMNRAIDVHHPYFGADRYKYFLDDSTYIAICRSCHHVVHYELSSEELIELGLRLKE